MRLLRCLWYILTLRCEEADRIGAVARPGDLTRSERIGARIHVLLCVSCRRARRQLAMLQELLNASATDETRTEADAEPSAPGLDAALRQRIAARLADRAGGKPDAK